MATAIAVAVLSAGLPYLLVLLSLEPAAAALMGLAILGQHLGPAELLAILLVVIASAGASWRTGPPAGQPAGTGTRQQPPSPPLTVICRERQTARRRHPGRRGQLELAAVNGRGRGGARVAPVAARE